MLPAGLLDIAFFAGLSGCLWERKQSRLLDRDSSPRKEVVTGRELTQLQSMLSFGVQRTPALVSLKCSQNVSNRKRSRQEGKSQTKSDLK